MMKPNQFLDRDGSHAHCDSQTPFGLKMRWIILRRMFHAKPEPLKNGAMKQITCRYYRREEFLT